MKIKMKKIYGIALVVCILVLSIASSTVAYFTSTDDKTTTFTSGNVKIELDSETANFANVYPGQTIAAPTVVTVTGSENAYVGAVITLNNAYITASNFASIFGGISNATYKQVDSNTLEVYVICTTELAKNGTFNVYNSITIPATWDHAEMTALAATNVTVKAYATQSAGFTSAAQALAAAFPGVWGTTPSN